MSKSNLKYKPILFKGFTLNGTGRQVFVENIGDFEAIINNMKGQPHDVIQNALNLCLERHCKHNKA